MLLIFYASMCRESHSILTSAENSPLLPMWKWDVRYIIFVLLLRMNTGHCLLQIAVSLHLLNPCILSSRSINKLISTSYFTSFQSSMTIMISSSFVFSIFSTIKKPALRNNFSCIFQPILICGGVY